MAKMSDPERTSKTSSSPTWPSKVSPVNSDSSTPSIRSGPARGACSSAMFCSLESLNSFSFGGITNGSFRSPTDRRQSSSIGHSTFTSIRSRALFGVKLTLLGLGRHSQRYCRCSDNQLRLQDDVLRGAVAVIDFLQQQLRRAASHFAMPNPDGCQRRRDQIDQRHV